MTNETENQKNLYLHIGTHKTGTTSIQHLLYTNRDHFRKLGVLYPETGLTGSPHQWGQHCLAWVLTQANMEGIWLRLRREAAPYSTVIISSEEFSVYLEERRFQRLKNAVPWASIKPVCYLRRQDEFFESLYNQYIKGGGTADINELFPTMQARLDYKNFLNVLSSVFGKENLIVRIYEKDRINGDICGDFFSSIGIAPDCRPSSPPRSVNKALSKEGLERLREANRNFADAPEELLKRRRQIVSEFTVPPFTPHSILSQDERRTLLDRFRASNEAVAREYFDTAGPLFNE